jgi:hypothetical protein
MYKPELKRQYYLKNKAKILKQRKAHYSTHKEQIKLKVKQYYITIRKQKLRQMPEIQTWYDMLNRCRNPKHKGYSYYGGRGIQVKYQDYCEFFHDVGPRPNNNYSIDRINNNGHYEQGNCRWATWSQQMRNRRGSCSNGR